MYVTLYRTVYNRPTRYFTMHDRQGNLFTPYSLTVSHGASISGGSERLYILESQRELDERIRHIIRRRLRDGYQVLYSYFRQNEPRAESIMLSLRGKSATG